MFERVLILSWVLLSGGSLAIADGPTLPGQATPPPTDRQRSALSLLESFGGGGEWQSPMLTRGHKRPWRVHANVAKDGGFKAKLSLVGVPGFEDVTIEAQLIDHEAFGVLLDGKGAQVGTFNATLSPDGSGGSFVLGNGESGTWGYDERTRAQLIAAQESAPATD